MKNGDTGPVAPRLVAFINRFGFKAGDRLPSIRQLAEELGVPANLIRDGMLQVQTMGLVKIHPRAGIFVQSVDYAPMVDVLTNTLQAALSQEDHGLFDLIDARRFIEIETAGLAAARRRPEDLFPLHSALEAMERNKRNHPGYTEADEQFHLAIAKVAGNTILNTVLRSVMVLLRPYKLMGFLPGRDLEQNRQSHEAIYHMVLNGDAKGARLEMRQHLIHARRTLLRNIQRARGVRRKTAREKAAG